MISNKKKGFTLIETLVVMVIIVILSLIIIPNYNSISQELAFQRSANKLAQEIRVVQEMAMSSEEFEGEVPAGGYGIYLRKNPVPRTSYTLFIDKDPADRKCSGCVAGSGEFIERVYLEGGIKILSISGGANHINIIFAPPDPTVFFTDADGIDLGLDQISIVISLISDETKTKTISVNKAGLVSID